MCWDERSLAALLECGPPVCTRLVVTVRELRPEATALATGAGLRVLRFQEVELAGAGSGHEERPPGPGTTGGRCYYIDAYI